MLANSDGSSSWSPKLLTSSTSSFTRIGGVARLTGEPRVIPVTSRPRNCTPMRCVPSRWMITSNGSPGAIRVWAIWAVVLGVVLGVASDRAMAAEPWLERADKLSRPPLLALLSAAMEAASPLPLGASVKATASPLLAVVLRIDASWLTALPVERTRRCSPAAVLTLARTRRSTLSAVSGTMSSPSCATSTAEVLYAA